MRVPSIYGLVACSLKDYTISYRQSSAKPRTAGAKQSLAHEKINALQSACVRTASWLGFVIGFCSGMSTTAVLALSILGN